jgi:CheY-like chemotaxis protein
VDKKPLILVADDEEDIKIVLEMYLETVGCEVVTSYDGLDAVEKVKERKPDLVLMDIMMPIIDGIEAVKQIKAIPECKDLPIIMLSAAAQSNMIKRAMEAGATDYISKPFEPDMVYAVVKKFLNI